MAESDFRPRIVRPGTNQRGLALVMVLWAAVILALIAGSVTRISRSDLQLVHNITEATKAELAADSAVRRAIFEIAAGRPGAWRTDGAVYGWRFGDAEVRVSVTDELGRVDINHASADLLASLFAAAGEREADALAEAVVSYRKQRRAEASGAGIWRRPELRDGLRRGVPFTSTQDLQNVAGVGPGLLRQLRPAVTVYSGRALPVIGASPPLVRIAMNAGNAPPSAAPVATIVGMAGNLTETPVLLTAPATPAPRGSGLYRVQAESVTEGGAHFAREAVVALSSGRDRAPYVVRLWHRGERVHFEDKP